ncbi:MAG: hypothetical protein AAF513_19600 [Pseudomonadota bacterium]
MSGPNQLASDLLAVMPPGIGDLTFASPEWVDAAREVLQRAVEHHASGLDALDTFTLCEVAHNPPAYLKCGNKLAWHARFEGATVTVASGELAAADCDFKMQGDHAVISNVGRILYQGSDPALVASAQQRLHKLSRWDIQGGLPEHAVLGGVLATLHDEMAHRTMPRFVFMTPEWVSTARYLLTSRANSEKYAADLRDVVYTFAEEFTHTPAYAFPDGEHGGFWVHCDHGRITVGAGPMPEHYAPADMYTLGEYTPIVPVGRTVNASMNQVDLDEQEAYRKRAFAFDKEAGKAPVEQSSPSGRGEMPKALARVFAPLHDELSKRTAGELPADFDDTIRSAWAAPVSFDRPEDYESWVRYDRVDIYGNPRT